MSCKGININIFSLKDFSLLDMDNQANTRIIPVNYLSTTGS